MHAFVPVPGGHASRLAETERTVLARLVADTAELLGTRLAETGSGAGTATGAGELPAAGGTRLTPDDAVLAALDFTPAEHLAPDAPADPALARLLPPMSHDDPELAAELRALTEGGLRSAKVSRLETVWRELRGPARPGGAAVVRTGKEGAWLAALTDVRLVLASRLGIEDDDDAEEVYDRAQSARSGGDDGDDGHDPVTDALATMYAALTWWQESLLESMERARRAK